MIDQPKVGRFDLDGVIGPLRHGNFRRIWVASLATPLTKLSGFNRKAYLGRSWRVRQAQRYLAITKYLEALVARQDSNLQPDRYERSDQGLPVIASAASCAARPPR